MKKKGHPLLGIHSALMMIFIYVPIVLVMVYSFNNTRLSGDWKGFTLDWYVSLLKDRHVMEALTNSLIVAVVSTIAATLLGTISALSMRDIARKWRGPLNGVLYMPVIIPDIIMGLSLLVLFSQLQIPLGKSTVMIAHITFSMSYVYVVVNARLAGMGRQLEEAAQDLGATYWQTFRHVTLPQITPGIISGALIAFTLSLDDFMVSFFVAGPSSTTLPIYIYGQVKRGISPEINALCTLLILVSITLILLAQYVLNRGKGQKKHKMLPF
ncbi:spermidine/putrescine ABC transporter permease [Paenibacillus macquariensis subsp. defensor]|uniref:Spermidine/putrescine transport system permease protein n=1 Tax=Paenibacillus macquariensis TaxID=948756 RepID=A0ABY1K5I5_9BACL|nr:ABC transporter permease [Paenibacillus macquariensis]MEC0090428.1 ABC transporter permease [Paenibacillus macquariensis]OAB26995.1 spermidine/putrescine ABC transporter permease [Paenibacillus macquariensis subsp. defensor]OAB35220.1 spermidine/putrescine ABC transporter permease [Paenibacillus macquariensis subsp. macquariensis]SIR28823.1 spermidine/putrescine transport system permease protein [Paenibacillus macquariensis]